MRGGPRIGRRRLIGLALAGGVAGVIGLQPGRAVAQMSAPEAHRRARQGKLVLIDIRRPDEWQETGIGEAAVPIDMRRDDFLAAVDLATGGGRAAPLALICARGVRSRRLAVRLERAGYAQVRDVAEGMLGSAAGAGWIARGLPVISYISES